MNPSGEAKLDAAEIERKEFDTGFRGYDQTSVREYLRRLSAVIRSQESAVDDAYATAEQLRQENQALAAELGEAQQRGAEAEQALGPAPYDGPDFSTLDETELTRLLGEETARVLASARQAGHDIVARAEAKAAAIDESSAKAKASAEAEVATYREDAAQKAAAERETAEAEALETVQRATTEAAELREKAEQLLASTTEEAHQKATQIVATAKEEADETRRMATQDGEAAKSAADELRENAEKVAAAIRHEADADSEAAQDAAREHARLMLVEAQSVREKVLSDLVQRRRVARQQLDGAKAARDRLARSMALVRQQLDESSTELQLSVPEARVAMETIARRENAAEDERDVVNLANELDASSPARSAALSTKTSGSGQQAKAAAPKAATPKAAATPQATVEAGPEGSNDGAGLDDAVLDAGEVLDDDVPDFSETAGAEAKDLDDIFARIRENADTLVPDTEAAPADTLVPDTGGAVAEPAPAAATSSSKKKKSKRARGAAAVVVPVENADQTDSDVTTAETAGKDTGAQDAAESVDDEPGAPSVFMDRDVAMARLGPDVRRHIKRAFADDQSDVLDRLRSGKGTPTIDELAPKEKLVMMVIDALTTGCTKAAERGSNAFGVGGGADISSQVETIANELVGPFRTRLELIVERGDADRDEILEPVRSLYRDLRGSELSQAADDGLAASFALGLYTSIGETDRVRWENDPRVKHGAECHDNLLAGAIAKGESFPTGHLHPLVEPGCRCLVVPDSYEG